MQPKIFGQISVSQNLQQNTLGDQLPIESPTQASTIPDNTPPTTRDRTSCQATHPTNRNVLKNPPEKPRANRRGLKKWSWETFFFNPIPSSFPNPTYPTGNAVHCLVVHHCPKAKGRRRKREQREQKRPKTVHKPTNANNANSTTSLNNNNNSHSKHCKTRKSSTTTPTRRPNKSRP